MHTGRTCHRGDPKKFPTFHVRAPTQEVASYRLKAVLWKGASLLQHGMRAHVRDESLATDHFSAKAIRRPLLIQ